MKESAAISARVLLIDTGPLVAYLDKADKHHKWAASVLPRLSGRLMTCEACLAEALHLVANSRRAVEALKALVERMELAPVMGGDAEAVFSGIADFSPEMDLADGCLVTLSRRMRALVVTTDERDFAIYRVPFLSPRGLFAGDSYRVEG